MGPRRLRRPGGGLTSLTEPLRVAQSAAVSFHLTASVSTGGGGAERPRGRGDVRCTHTLYLLSHHEVFVMNFRTCTSLTRNMYPQFPHSGLQGHALVPMLAALCIVFLDGKPKDFRSAKHHESHERTLKAAIKAAKKLDSIEQSETIRMVADHNGCSVKKLIKQLRKGVAAKGSTGVAN